MKGIFAALYSCLVCFTCMAQPNKTPGIFANDTAAGTGTVFRWLQVKPALARIFFMQYRRQVLRQLGPSQCIVRKDAAIDEQYILHNLPAGIQWKLSPRLLAWHDSLKTTSGVHSFLVQFSGAPPVIDAPGITLVRTANSIGLIKGTYAHVYAKIIGLDQIVFADMVNDRPAEELAVPGLDNTLNTINYLQHQYPGIDGSGLVVSVKEDRPDTADIDFKNRLLLTNAASNNFSTHASLMATIVAGAGNSFYTSRGVAPAATITSSSFNVLLPDSDAYYQRFRISVQNHSYGTSIENFYGADALAYDASVVNRPSLLHVFSAGNYGNLGATAGQYTGLAGFANLTGSFKMAKNIITVGATDSLGNVAPLSSKGPAYDGRIKPELVAYGSDGSSGSAALVSGTALALQQLYQKRRGSLPDAALVKAVLLNTATDAGRAGIDFTSGYGSMDAQRAAQVMDAGQYFAGSVLQGQVQTFALQTPATAGQLKIMLCWTDPPANANALKALVNDLDLTVTDKLSGKTWQPWVLNVFPAADSLQLLPRQQRDSLNNTEQVTISNSPAHDFIISVKGYEVPAGSQPFFVAYQWDTVNTFHFTYPTGTDNVLAGKPQFIHWQSNLSGSAEISFKFMQDTAWHLLTNNAAPVSGHFLWQAPDTNALAILRVRINGSEWLSDTFTLSEPLQTGLGYNCQDTALVYWNNGSRQGYRVYGLGNQYMQPVLDTKDTMALLQHAPAQDAWYAVAPVLSGTRTGVRSLAFNYRTQGVGCYYNNFLADLRDGSAVLQLSLGTLFGITGIAFEKQTTAGTYQTLQFIPGPLQLQYSIEDKQLDQGLNQYRVRIILPGGRELLSPPESVLYMAGKSYLVYPNPVTRGGVITFSASVLNNQVIQIFNGVGQKLIEQKMNNFSLQIQLAALGAGPYFYTISVNAKKEAAGIFIIQ